VNSRDLQENKTPIYRETRKTCNQPSKPSKPRKPSPETVIFQKKEKE
jgi:hypothetical protein